MMTGSKSGSKSILFGVHQVFWHPITVWLAWVWLYRWFPTWRECVCIVVHDLGYFGKANMDGPEGKTHPEVGGRIAEWLLGPEYGDLVRYHSRSYALKAGRQPSALCWPDKLAVLFDPWWFYLPRALASGEIHEFRRVNAENGMVPATASHREWYQWLQTSLREEGLKHRGTVHRGHLQGPLADIQEANRAALAEGEAIRLGIIPPDQEAL